MDDARLDLARRGPYRRWLIVILGAAVALHFTSLRAPFFADDYFFLEQARGRSLLSTLQSADPLGNFLRPVSRQIYFWTVSRLGHESPIPFHVLNLSLLLGCLVVLQALVRRWAGPAAALVATVFFAFHYAPDVPLRWASGSQDLLALFFATLTIYLQVRGRRILAMISLLLALFSKESVALTAAVALFAAHQPGRPWTATLRRGLGLIAVTCGWAVAWAGSVHQRSAIGSALSFSPSNFLAAFVHLPQVALGLEFRAGGNPFGHWTMASVLMGLLAAALMSLGPPPRGSGSAGEDQPASSRGSGTASEHQPAGRTQRSSQRRAVRVGAAWTLAGVLPLILVMPIWSAYFYLYALLGIACLVGAIAASLSRVQRAAIVGALVCLSVNARMLDEFSSSRGAWSAQSHVNRHYLLRAMETVERYTRSLKAARPTLPERSTVFFANVPVSSGWQAGNGPLIRWAYRDTSLRSYFLSQFSSPMAERGPVFFFAVDGDSLTDRSNDPMLLPSFAYSLLLVEQPQGAADALDQAIARRPDQREFHYWRAWARWAVGDSSGAGSDLAHAGARAARGVSMEARQRIGALGQRDSSLRVALLLQLRDQAALEPWVHARLAAACLASPRLQKQGVIEAYAFRVLAPQDPDAWRKWAAAQLSEAKYEGALASLDHYIRLAGESGQLDGEARRTRESLRRLVSGDLAHRSLHEDP